MSSETQLKIADKATGFLKISLQTLRPEAIPCRFRHFIEIAREDLHSLTKIFSVLLELLISLH